MSKRDWKFQWPDGTWIRWNPETETWEREAGGGAGEGESLADLLEPPLLPQGFRPPVGPVSGPEATPSDLDDKYFLRHKEPSLRLAEEILPPAEEEAPKPSVLPAVIVGCAVGLGAGYAVLTVIR